MEEIPEELIARLVDEVAVTGTFGLGEDTFKEAVTTFYNEQYQSRDQQQDVAVADGQRSENHHGVRTMVDDDILVKFREQLEQHRDIHVKTDNDGIRLADAEGEDPTTKARHAGRVLIATTERMRRALSHRPGTRVEPMGALHFDCLSVIAAYGPAGVLQNDLRRVTGQQKQSVPGRTDQLARRGYIAKRTVLAQGTKTSLLTLKRWAGREDAVQSAHPQRTLSHRSGQTIIDYDLWFNETISLLKAQPHCLIAIQDVKIGLGIIKKKYETRALMRCIRRLSHEGVLRTVSAKPTYEEGRTVGKAIRCIQLVREPTEADRATWKTRTARGKRHSKNGVVDESSADDEAVASDDDDEGSVEDPDTVDPNVPGDADAEQELMDETDRGPADGDAVEVDEHQSPVGKRKRTAPRRLDSEPDYNASTKKPSVDDGERTGKRKRAPTRRFIYDSRSLESDNQTFEDGGENDESNHDFVDEIREVAEQPRKKRKYTKRQHDGPKLPIVRTKPRITVEKSNPKFEAWAKRTAEKLTKIQARAEQEAAKLESEQQTQPALISSGDQGEAEEGAETFKQRTARLEGELLARTRNGVYVNPPGALDLKASTVYQRGRPRNACIAVIKSDRLGDLELPDTPKAPKSKTPPAGHIDVQVREGEQSMATPQSSDKQITPEGLQRAHQSAESTRTALNASTKEYFTKEYTQQHPNEQFHHCGNGRYKRGPRNAKTTTESAVGRGSLSTASSSRAPSLTAVGGRRASLDEYAIDGSPAPRIQDEPTYEKDYVDAYPGERFYHVGGGRWRRGSKPDGFGRRSSTTKRRAANVARTETLSSVATQRSISLHESQPQCMKDHSPKCVSERQALKDMQLPMLAASAPRSPSRGTSALPANGAHVPASATSLPSSSDLVRSAPMAALARLRKERHRPTEAILAESARLQKGIEALPRDETVRLNHESTNLAKAKPCMIAKLSIPALTETGMDELLREASIKRASDGALKPKPAVVAPAGSKPQFGTMSQLSTVSNGPDYSIQRAKPVATTQTSALPAFSPLTIIRPYHTPTSVNQVAQSSAGVIVSSRVATFESDGCDGEEEIEEDAIDVDIFEPLDDDRAAEGDSDFEPDAGEPDFEEPDDSGMETDRPEPKASKDFGYPRTNSKLRYGTMERQRFANEDQKRRQRASIIIDLLEQCGGAFPGNGEIFFPFCREWHKTHDVMPDRRTITAAVQRMVEDGKLKHVPFSFRDDEGESQEKIVLTFPYIESTSVLVDEVKKAMIRAYPSRYLPEEVGGQQVEDEFRRIESARNGDGALRDEFPVMDGLTVQRTQQAIDMADAVAQAKGSTDSRSRRLQQMRAGAKRQNVRRKKRSGLFSGAREGAELAVLDADDDYSLRSRPGHRNSSISTHESPAVGARAATTMLLMSASQRYYPNSGTFSTETPVEVISWSTTQPLPRSLDEVLQRVELMGYPKGSGITPGIDEFSSIVDRVYAWEADMRTRAVLLTNNAEWQFINLTIAETHITASPGPDAEGFTLDKLVEFDSPESFVSKEYTLAHPDDVFHHVGAGRYRRGPRPPDYSRGKKPFSSNIKQKRNIMSTGIPCFTKAYVDAHPNEEFYRISGGLYRRGPKPANYNSRGEPKPTPLPKQEYFSKEFKDAHPDEEFYHIGGGRYRRGRMPDGYRDPFKRGGSKRYDRERSNNYGWTYHKTVKPSQRRAPNDAAGQARGAQAAERVEYSVPSFFQQERLEVPGKDADSDPVFDGEDVHGADPDDQPILPSSVRNVNAKRGTQQAGLLSSELKTLTRDLKRGKLKFKENSVRYDKEYKQAHPEVKLLHVGAGRYRNVADIIERDAPAAGTPAEAGYTPQIARMLPSMNAPVADASNTPRQGVVVGAPSTSVSWHALSAPADADDRSPRKYRSRKRLGSDAEVTDLPFDADGGFEPEEDETNPTKRARLTNGQPAPKRKSGGRPRVRGFPDGEDLLMSVAIVRVLCGGLYQTSIKWELVAHAMSFRYEPEYLSKRWNPVRVGSQGRVETLQEAIREPFLQAYEKGDLPSIDFQHLENTDWPAVLEWVKRIDPQSSVQPPGQTQVTRRQVVELPASVDGLEDDFIMSSHATLIEPDLEQHFRAVSGEQRAIHALRHIEGIPLTSQSSFESSASLEILKSWCRAVSVAKSENYNGPAATRKISTKFSDEMIKRAVNGLQADSILTQEKGGSQVPGRNFRLHNATLKQFRRWPEEECNYLREVAAARERVIAHFDTHDSLELTMHTRDSEIVVLTNMMSQGHLKVTSVLPEQNNDIDAPMPRLSVWGIDGIQTIYDSKNVDPSRLRFPLIYRWTPKFTSRHGLQQIPVPLSNASHNEKEDLRIPFWVDIHGNLVDEIWDMVLRSVLWLLVFRPGYVTEGIQKAHDNKLWAFEIEMVLTWMEQTGLAQRFGAGKEVDGVWKGGWRASEWWYCAFASDIATWEAPVAEVR